MVLNHLGFFCKPIIDESEIGPLTFVFTDFLAEYLQSDQLMKQVAKIMRNTFSKGVFCSFFFCDKLELKARGRLPICLGAIVDPSELHLVPGFLLHHKQFQQVDLP